MRESRRWRGRCRAVAARETRAAVVAADRPSPLRVGGARSRALPPGDDVRQPRRLPRLSSLTRLLFTRHSSSSSASRC